jgi:hypothetical protein
MKKGISISLSLLMMTAMLHFSVATHYCHGNVAASKISLSGQHATCGMEDEENEIPLPGIHLDTNCCDDVVFYYGIDAKYAPSFSFVPEFYKYKLQDFSSPGGLPVISASVLKSLYNDVSPPAVLMSTNVDLSDICVFRI